MKRRDVLGLALTALPSAACLTKSAAAEPAPVSRFSRTRIVDTNVSLFRWPFRRLPLDGTERLIAKLRSLGVEQAWAGNFEGLLHRDIAAVNQRLADECNHWLELVPIGSINPTLPSWERDLERCEQEFNMPGVRLHPNYHGYRLDDRRVTALLEQAAASSLFVQITVAMEDTRTQSVKFVVSDVDLAPLPKLLESIRSVRIQLLNHRLRGGQLKRLAAIPNLYFDTARVESTDGVPHLVDSTQSGRTLFGSHAPFLIPESAVIRAYESGLLNGPALRELLANNARRLMTGAGA